MEIAILRFVLQSVYTGVMFHIYHRVMSRIESQEQESK